MKRIVDHALCRSELAREEPESAAIIQMTRVIVNDLRERARSYKKRFMGSLENSDKIVR